MNCCGFCDPRLDYRLAGDIAEYIHDEMKDSRYYAILSGMVPTMRARDILIGFSRDEWNHAQQHMQAYQMLTGRAYALGAVEEPAVPEFGEALKVRILAETADYEKYGRKYLEACSPALKEMFYMMRTQEAMHAMRMPVLMMGG